VLGAAMLVAGGLDYAVSVVAGRWLDPVEFGVFVAVTAVLQVLLSVATTLRMVVAFYAADLGARSEGAGGVGSFLRGAAAWCLRWGLASTAAMAAVSPALARAFHLNGPAPLWAASAMVLMFFIREPTLGALQGLQAFGRLGAVQVSQAALRLALAAGLLWAGGRAAGAIAAQPLAAAGAVLLAFPVLRRQLATRTDATRPQVSRAYVLSTLAGLALFGLLTNLDALFVKIAYPPRVAGDFGTVATFEKMSLFLPWAISFVLFPKATQRTATGRDPRPLLLAALAAVLAPGALLSVAYLVAPGAIVRLAFSAAYADPGPVLGLVSLAATLFAGVNIWLNYALSTGRTRFIGALGAVVALQAAALWGFGRTSLVAVSLVMVATGLLGNAAGFLVAWSAAPGRAPRVQPVVAERPGPERWMVRVLAGALVVLTLGYVGLFASLDGLPLQDLPNHLARATIVSDLLFHGGARFGATYSLHLMPAPYLLHDLALASAVQLLGPYAAGRAWLILTFLAPTAALAVYLRLGGHRLHTVLIASVLSLYLATDFSFVTGFTCFRLAVATTLLALAAFGRWLERGRAAGFLVYTALVLVGYLLHLSSVFFTALGAGALTLLAVRIHAGELTLPVATLRRAVAAAFPLAAVVAWEVHAAGAAPGGATQWATPLAKLSGVFFPFHRYDLRTEALLFGLFAAELLLLARGGRRVWRSRAVWVPGGLSLFFFGVYAALPYGRSFVTYIDSRALTFAWTFAVIAALAIAQRAGHRGWAAVLLPVALAALNLIVVARHVLPNNEVSREIRAVAGQVPEGSTFISIDTHPKEGNTNPFLHAGLFATIERGARSPYLFTGGTTRFFVARPHMVPPSEFWYQKADRPWLGAQIVDAFRYVLATKPLDRALLPAPTRVLAEDRAAVLLEVTRPPRDAAALP
jgi:O-antigen/teichoic acid export membrane protein